MLIVHVPVHVKPESVADFRQGTIENAGQSVQEPRLARFDVVEVQNDRIRFVLIEVYRSAEAPAAYKETGHYAKWRDIVAEMTGIAAGALVKIISDLLGRASISFMLEPYSHLLPSIEDEVAAKVEKLLVA
jgi:(4S)-4-hydroxy-5-phosphonooxypentane-2,3-dione isomerase